MQPRAAGLRYCCLSRPVPQVCAAGLCCRFAPLLLVCACDVMHWSQGVRRGGWSRGRHRDNDASTRMMMLPQG